MLESQRKDSTKGIISTTNQAKKTIESAAPMRTARELVTTANAPEDEEPEPEPEPEELEPVTLAVLVGEMVAKAPLPERTGLPIDSCTRLKERSLVIRTLWENGRN